MPLKPVDAVPPRHDGSFFLGQCVLSFRALATLLSRTEYTASFMHLASGSRSRPQSWPDSKICVSQVPVHGLVAFLLATLWRTESRCRGLKENGLKSISYVSKARKDSVYFKYKESVVSPLELFHPNIAKTYFTFSP